MKTCQNCNTQNNDNANFCRHCGTPFPNALKNDKRVNVSILKKIEELQLLVQGYANKLSDSKRDIKKIKEENNTLSSMNNSLQAEYSRCEKREKIANEEVQHLKKKIESIQSEHSMTHIFYIIIIILLVLSLLNKCNSSNNKISDTVINDDEQIKTIQNDNDSLKEQNSELRSLLSTIDGNQSIYIKSIEVRNADESYGQTIYSSNTTYLNPKIELFSFIEGYVDIYIKLYDPMGLTTGNESPKGYSIKDNVYLNKDKMNTIELIGWGSNNKGNWMSGKYRYEFYYEGKLIGYKDFIIQ